MATKTITDNIDNAVDSYLGFLKNEYVVTGVTLFLILYAGIIAPRLSPRFLALFDNWIVQVALFFGIVYLSEKNVTVAIIATIALLVTLMSLNNYKVLRVVRLNENFCGCSDSITDHPDTPIIDDEDLDLDFNEDLELERDLNRDQGVAHEQVLDQDAEEVQGVLDENIEELHDELAENRHAVNGGAITSRDFPLLRKLKSGIEERRRRRADRRSERAFAETESEAEESENSEVEYGVIGVDENVSEEESASLDESNSLGYENAGANHGEAREEAPKSAEEAVRVAVENVSHQIERDLGDVVPEQVKEEVVAEVKAKILSLAKKRPVGEFDVISVCRDTFRKHI